MTVNQGYPFLIGAPGGPDWPFRTSLSHHVYCSQVIRAGVGCPAQERQAVGNARDARHNDVAPLRQSSAPPTTWPRCAA